MIARLSPALLLAAACAHSPAAPPAPADPELARYQAIVAADDRTEEDRKLDAGRKPAEFLRFLGAKPGMKVAELFAGGGYTAELLARAVAPDGVVYGHNTPGILEAFAEKPWSARLARPQLKNVVRVDRELHSPLPPNVTELDLVVSNAIYHDAAALGVDRFQMNQAVYQALRSGGAYVVCDSSAQPGTGTEQSKTLHRIDEQVVRDEVTVVGFSLAEESAILRNPADTRDWNASPVGPARGTSDRFCLKFVRP